MNTTDVAMTTIIAPPAFPNLTIVGVGAYEPCEDITLLELAYLIEFFAVMTSGVYGVDCTTYKHWDKIKRHFK